MDSCAAAAAAQRIGGLPGAASTYDMVEYDRLSDIPQECEERE
jgi:hypothetical protein